MEYTGENLLGKVLDVAGKLSVRGAQKEIGASEIGGCRRALWHRLQDTPTVNHNTLSLAAFMGTAIHRAIEGTISNLDPFMDDIETEVEVQHGGLKGHVDLFIKSAGEVVDWKTTTKKSLSYFPSEQQRWQVHLYGWLLSQDLEYEVKTVTLVAIARDGNEKDVKVFSEPYDREIAMKAMEWLEDVKARTEAPQPEREARVFCQSYCGYYDPSGDVGCTGLEKAGKKNLPLLDADQQKAVKEYLAMKEQVDALDARMDALKEQLLGVEGQTDDGDTIKWSERAGRKSVDVAAVEKALGEVPYVTGNPSVSCTIAKAK